MHTAAVWGVDEFIAGVCAALKWINLDVLKEEPEEQIQVYWKVCLLFTEVCVRAWLMRWVLFPCSSYRLC